VNDVSRSCKPWTPVTFGNIEEETDFGELAKDLLSNSSLIRRRKVGEADGSNDLLEGDVIYLGRFVPVASPISAEI